MKITDPKLQKSNRNASTASATSTTFCFALKVRGPWANSVHRKREELEIIIPDVRVDNMFTESVQDQGTKCIFVAKERDTRVVCR